MPNEKGFTLIEILAALGIIAIITVTYLSLSTTEVINIHNAGTRSKTLFQAQKDMEEQIGAPSPTGTAGSVSINFSDNPEINVTGKTLLASYQFYNQTHSLTYFQPDPEQTASP